MRSGSDSDGDLLPDAWESTYGLDPSNPADAAADANGNGSSNLMEYALAGQPLSRNSRGLAKPLSAELVAGGGKQISFRRRIPGGTQLDYQIEKSNDLIEWRADPGDGLMFSEVSVERNGDASETVVIEDVEGTGGQPTFYRLRVGF